MVKVLLHGNSATWGFKLLAARSIFNHACLPALTAEREGFGEAQGGSANPLEWSRTYQGLWRHSLAALMGYVPQNHAGVPVQGQSKQLWRDKERANLPIRGLQHTGSTQCGCPGWKGKCCSGLTTDVPPRAQHGSKCWPVISADNHKEKGVRGKGMTQTRS